MLNYSKQIKYWKENATEDFETAEFSFLMAGLFMDYFFVI